MDVKDHHLLRVLMFPWLAHGHIFPFLELAKELHKRNFYIYFCSTPINLSFINEHLNRNEFPSIQLVELHLPSLPNLPPSKHTTKSLPPHLMPTLKAVFDMAEQSFSQILTTLHPDVLIYDFLQPWASTIASLLNIPAIHFLTTGAFTAGYMYQLCKKNSPNAGLPILPIHLEEHEDEKAFQKLSSTSHGLSDKERFLQSIDQSMNLFLIKTFGEIEEKYINSLSLITGKTVIPVGPLVHEPPTDDKHTSSFINWLDKKDKSSTVLVSCGSESYLSREEIEEMAYGLELSEVNFIWVIRFPDQGEQISLSEVLPKEFMGRIGERGMVVEGWAPQVDILKHSSIGGFVSHCGWSSVMEGLKLGVPIIAMPMQLDQPLNAKLVVEMGVGLEVNRNSSGSRKFAREEVANVIREVIMGNEGENHVKQKATKISEKMREQGDEDIDDLVEMLLHLSGKIKA
ncbi:hypothetical protein Scep_008645 [Stephania cephalantha]|uniref:Glycosyltransferase n=1 Tax=Stephania cephalantha TaxID=152367 RepID=A0AAP0PMA7_9MAGN